MNPKDNGEQQEINLDAEMTDLLSPQEDVEPDFDYEEKIKSLEEELRLKNEEAKENYDKYLRVMADFDNFRKRVVKERQEHSRYACENLLKNLLPTLDNLQRATASVGENQDFKSVLDGIKMIQENLLGVLQKEGLEPLNAKAEKFDPYLHDAVIYEEADNTAEGTVIAELQTGYKYHERILRHAMVKVAKAKA